MYVTVSFFAVFTLWYNMSHMEKIGIYITKLQKDRLSKIEELTEMPRSEIVRRAIDFYLEENNEKSKILGGMEV